MSDSRTDGSKKLPQQLWQRQEELIAQFESLFQQGKSPRIEDFLSKEGIDRYSLLVELVHTDLELRLNSGEPRKIEEYLTRFPVLSTEDQSLRELIITEYFLRKRVNHQIDPAEYAKRFPQFGESLINQLQRVTEEQRKAGSPVENSLQETVIYANVLTSTHSTNSTQVSPQNDEKQNLGRFQIINKIGQGAFGTVYQAYDPKLDMNIALKIPRIDLLESQDDRDRFFREAKAAVQLEHPNIVQVFECGVIEETPFISSRFITGQTLKSIINSQEQISTTAAIDLIRQLADALQCAHNKGVIHRDMKPDNILIDDSGKPYILDFGLARLEQGLETLTQEGTHMGTPAYMSPEQASGKSHLADARSDLWSLGVIFYELLTRKRPFVAENVIALLQEITNREPENPRTITPALSKDIASICLKCFRKEPEQRYASCQHLIEDLERFNRGEPILARPVSVSKQMMMWCLRNKVIAVSVVTVLLSLLGGIIVSLHYASEANKQAIAANHNAGLFKQAKTKAEKSALKARQQLYANSMNLIQLAMDSGDIDRAWSLMNEQWPKPGEADLRGFEWYCLWHLLESELTAFQGHQGRVTCVAWSPDGTMIATGSDNREIRLWDSQSGRSLATLHGHNEVILGLDFSDDGKLLASACGDQTIKIWNPQNGQLEATLKGHTTPVSCVDFSPDQKYLVSGSQKNMKLWNLNTFQVTKTLTGHSNFIRDVQFSPNGETLMSCSSDKTIRVWDWKSGTEMKLMRGHDEVVHSIDFSPDGKQLVSGSWDGSVKLWETSTWKLQATFEREQDMVRSVAFSGDGKTVAAGGLHPEFQVVLWDVASHSVKKRLKTDQSMIWGVQFSPTTQTLVSVGDAVEKTSGPTQIRRRKIKLWDTKKEEQKQIVPEWNSRSVKRWNLDTWGWDAQFSYNDQYIAVGKDDGVVDLLDLKTGKSQNKFNLHSKRVKAIALSPNGEYLASGGEDAFTLIHHIPSGSLFRKIDNNAGVEFLDFSSNSKYLIKNGLKNSAALLNIQTGEEFRFFTKHQQVITQARFSSDGKRLVTASLDGTAIIWDVETGSVIHQLDGQGSAVNAVAFSPDGRFVAMGCGDRVIRLWDSQTGQLEKTLKGHQGGIQTLAFSPNLGGRLVSGSSDFSVKVWDIETGQNLLSLPVILDETRGLSFSNDGRMLGVIVKGFYGKKIGLLKVWRTANREEIFKSLSMRASRQQEETELQIAFVLGCWNLAIEEPALPKKKSLLRQGLKTLKLLREEQRLSVAQTEWISLFDSEISRFNSSATKLSSDQ